MAGIWSWEGAGAGSGSGVGKIVAGAGDGCTSHVHGLSSADFTETTLHY